MAGLPDLDAIAGELRLRITEEAFSGCDGVLVRPKGIRRGIIAVRKDIRSRGRKRFTIAHEIGHYILPGHEEDGAICGSADIEGWGGAATSRERQADDFAAELLIPASVVRPSLSPPSLAAVDRIASQCDTSLSASAWRFCDLTGEMCAVVWSSQGKVIWIKKSSEFAFYIPKGMPIDRNSYAYNCYEGEEVPKRPESVPADAWIDSANLVDGARIFEESRSLPSYDSVLTLLWVKENIQKRSEHDQESEEPLDPLDFTVFRKRWPK